MGGRDQGPLVHLGSSAVEKILKRGPPPLATYVLTLVSVAGTTTVEDMEMPNILGIDSP